MAIVLQDSTLENELVSLAAKLHIKVEELLKKIVTEQINQAKQNSIDTSFIEEVSTKEKEEILKSLSKTSAEDNEIDTNATKTFSL